MDVLLSSTALARRGFDCGGLCHRLLFVLSGSEKFQNYGVVQKHVSSPNSERIALLN